MSWTQWTSVLMLSLMWQMKQIQDLALKKIPTRIHNSDEWTAALDISTQLRLQGLREMAIRELSGNLSSLKQVEFAVKYSIQPWLIEGYTAFVARAQGISEEDEEQLGPSRTANLWRVRHRQLDRTQLSHNITSDIQTTFQSEFTDILAFDNSPISYLQPDLCTVTDPDAIRRDKAYYFIDTIFLVKSFKSLPMYLVLILLQVEDTLFKLPRCLFEESSEVFRDMFLLPSPEDVSCDGSSDEQPLFLEGVRKAHFRQLLKAMKFPACRSGT